jgi:dynein heavy chain
MTDGCYVSGLYLEGAAWNVENQCLIRQPPKVLVQELPIMMIIPVELNKLKLHGTIRVPLYITQQRRNAMGKRECTRRLVAPCHVLLRLTG